MNMNRGHQNRMPEHRAAIKAWFDAVISNGGIDRMQDIHVDAIDKAWKQKGTWVAAALESFGLALNVRNESGYEDSLSGVVPKNRTVG